MTSDIIADIEVALGRSAISKFMYRMWWPKIEIDHESNVYDKEYLKKIRAMFGKPKMMGVYVYEFTDACSGEQKTLYIGKSKDIAYRLFNHYRERHDQTGHPAWRTFWNTHQYKMSVYVKEINHKGDDYLDEASRIIAERYMIASLKPISENTIKSVK